MTIALFEQLIIETATLCNRQCPTCLRNSDPTRSRWEGEKPIDVKLPAEIFYSIVDQAIAMGYGGRVYPNWYNEPLLDLRILNFLQYIRKKGLPTGLDTNADSLVPGKPESERFARELNAALNWIRITRYSCGVAKSKWLLDIFGKKIRWTDQHLISHYGRSKVMKPLLEWARTRPCANGNRLIIDYKGTMRLCCEDLVGNFDLGNVYDSSLKELWYSPKHVKILKTLAEGGGRSNYSLCSICPLPGTVHLRWLKKCGIPVSSVDPTPCPVTTWTSIRGRA